MFERLARLFRKKFDKPSTELTFPELSWLEADQNEFGLRVLDCRPFSHSMLSLTKDESVAIKFKQLRRSTGIEYVGKEPEEPITTDCRLTYRYCGEVEDGPLFIADRMEDKWDIYLYEGHLYFARSWTGDLGLKAEVSFPADECLVSSVQSCGLEDDGTPNLSIRQVDFLIKRHLYKREVPHPIPRSIPESPRDIALYSFSIYGRWASFASFEDTTTVRLT